MSLFLASAVLAGGLFTKYACSFYQQLVKTARVTGKPTFYYFYPGGFLPKMTKKEASLILDVGEHSHADTVKQAFKRVMIVNHPDRGGSPYIAAKVTEAKNIMEGH